MGFENLIRGFSIWQSCASLLEMRERTKVYDLALRQARMMGKPLVVAGGSKGRHGTGDLCVDIDPRSCQGATTFLQADIRSIPLPDKFAGAVFASHVLEHLRTVRDAEIALCELQRIGDFVYVVSPHKWNIFASLHPDHHLWVTRKGQYLLFQQR